MSGHYNETASNGFTSGYGRFFAEDRIERIEGSRLRAMFLPRLTPETNALLRNHRNFVRAQLQHYGVEYELSEFSGNGTLLLKKVLQAGKCDKVPDHIRAIELKLHAEWLEKQPPEGLSEYPQLVMEKYFVDGSGKPDPSKTTGVVGIPYPLFSRYRTGHLQQAVGGVHGLHHATGTGCETQTIYLGWNHCAVRKAALEHAAKEQQESQVKATNREAERASQHETYLKKSKNAPTSPAGQYMVDCEEIESQWPDDSGDMTLSISSTSSPDIYQVHFNFGVTEGMMILSWNKSILEEYCAEAEPPEGLEETDSEGYDEEDDSSSQDESEEDIGVGSKRKAKATSEEPAKKLKMARPIRPRKYFLRLKSRDTGTGQIYHEAESGSIKFDTPQLSSFTAQADMECIGRNVFFIARKVSDKPETSWETWAEYSFDASERARVGRWG